MTATHSIASTVLVAIDISKHRHEVLISIPGKKRRRRLTITNTLEDFQRLATSLASYELPVRLGFEATGNYRRPLAHHLGQAGFDLKLISSVGLARTREALHNSWDKNDPKDAHLRRKAYTAIAAKMARTVHAVIKHGEPCPPSAPMAQI
ncbi:hypothetical protein GCM10010961_44940 [Pseudodonghicola xiamenensis]|uniref:Transposase IS110-like N-terminal domain-containing protein n=1 Tax=Pseudodonghicola xiamenensis TaxID=337702 RepID=A0A8J3MFV5_9RHOB|nr:hypothetical protein GCM10010961_44940 [Pseudodonghicola xiamenensis]